ncbi:MAG: hypothetical protein J7M26_05905, partial [Armatimonadetes bacterium]|nr:hypothetical protein [Armatimonadota bacterium]
MTQELDKTPQRSPCRWVSVLVGLVLVAAMAPVVVRSVNSPARYNRTHTAISGEELLSQCPWLKDTMHYWRAEVDLQAGPPKYADLGAFPVGNGRVFGIVGLQWPLTTIGQLIGPSYQKQLGFFGNIVPWVAAEGKPVDLAQQSIAWAKEAPVVCVRTSSPDGLKLDVYYAAVPDQPAIVFVAAVGNNSKRVRRGLALNLSSNQPSAEVTPSGLVTSRGNIVMTAGLVGARGLPTALTPSFPAKLSQRLKPLAAAGGAAVAYPLGTLGPGQTVAKMGYVIFTTDQTATGQVVAALEQARLGVLDNCRAAWQQWNKQVASLKSGSPRLDEFFEAQKYIVACQQADGSGFSPMHGYTYLWVRDSNGPLRFFTAIGASDRIKQHLEYHFRACAK